jgi:hypothetical protein
MDMRRLAGEIFRVLRPGGRAIITEIPRDEALVEGDPERIAHREEVFRQRLAEAGFQDVTVLERQEAGRRSLPGMGLRSVTVAAYKRRRFGREQQHDAAVLGASGSA